MSKILSATIENPNGKEDTCAFVQVTGQELYYLLSPIEALDKYTISFWIRAVSSEIVIIHYGDQTKEIAVNTEWQKVVFSFTAEYIDNVMLQFTTGNYYIYNTKLERGDVATDYSESPKDMEEQLAEIEKVVNTKYSEVMQALDTYKIVVGETYSTKQEVKKVEASLELKVGVNDNDKIVSMINASADEINLKSNRFSLESDNTTIDKDGYIKTVGGNIGGWEIVKDGISSTTQDELGNIYRTKLYPSTPIINTPLLTCEISTDGGNTFEEYLALYPGGRIKGKQIFTTIIKPSDKEAYDAITIDSEFVEVKGELYAKKVTTSSGADLDKLNKSAPKLAAASNFTSSVTTKTFNVSAGDELIFIGSGSGSTRVLVRIFSTSAFFYESGTTILTGTPVSTFTLSGSGISLTLENGVLTVTRGGAWSDIHYMHYHIG